MSKKTPTGFNQIRSYRFIGIVLFLRTVSQVLENVVLNQGNEISNYNYIKKNFATKKKKSNKKLTFNETRIVKMCVFK